MWYNTKPNVQHYQVLKSHAYVSKQGGAYKSWPEKFCGVLCRLQFDIQGLMILGSSMQQSDRELLLQTWWNRREVFSILPCVLF